MVKIIKFQNIEERRMLSVEKLDNQFQLIKESVKLALHSVKVSDYLNYTTDNQKKIIYINSELKKDISIVEDILMSSSASTYINYNNNEKAEFETIIDITKGVTLIISPKVLEVGKYLSQYIKAMKIA